MTAWKSSHTVIELKQRLEKVALRLWSPQERERFYLKLATHLDAGVSPRMFAEKRLARVLKASPRSVEARVLKKSLEGIRAGMSFAASLQESISSAEYMILSSGEAAGKLPEALRTCCKVLKTTRDIRRRIIAGSFQPTLYALLSLLGFWYMGTEFVPQLAAVIDPSTWTGTAALLYRISVIMTSPFGALPLVFLVCLTIAVGLSFSRWTGRWRVMADRIPPWAFYRVAVGGGWLMSVAAFISSGISVKDALLAMRKDLRSNPWLQERVQAVVWGISRGQNLGEALQKAGHDFPDRSVVEDMADFAELPDFDQNIIQLAENWAAESLLYVDRVSGMLRAVMFVIAGILLTILTMGMMGSFNQIIVNARS